MQQFKNGSWLICNDDSRNFYGDYVYVIEYVGIGANDVPRYDAIWFKPRESSVSRIEMGLLAVPWEPYEPKDRNLQTVVKTIFGKNR
jgi:hypothetical protein